MFQAVREPAELKNPLMKSVLLFGAAGTLIFWFGFRIVFSVLPPMQISSQTVFTIIAALTGAALWFVLFFALRAMLRVRSYDLYWALAAVAAGYNAILGFLSREGEKGWVIFTVANLDFALLVALLGLAYRRYNYIKVFSLVGFILVMGLVRTFTGTILMGQILAFAFSALMWLAFSYAFVTEIDSISQSRKRAS